MISNFCFPFLGGFSKFPSFDTLAQKAHPKNTIKIGVSSPFFEKQLCVTKRPFLDQKNKIHKFQLSFVCLFSSFFFNNNNKPQKLLKPLFYSALANLKKDNFQKKLKRLNIEKTNFFAPLFGKRLFLENSKITGNKKTQTDNWAPKITWNPNFYSAKMTWPS